MEAGGLRGAALDGGQFTFILRVESWAAWRLPTFDLRQRAENVLVCVSSHLCTPFLPHTIVYSLPPYGESETRSRGKEYSMRNPKSRFRASPPEKEKQPSTKEG